MFIRAWSTGCAIDSTTGSAVRRHRAGDSTTARCCISRWTEDTATIQAVGTARGAASRNRVQARKLVILRNRTGRSLTNAGSCVSSFWGNAIRPSAIRSTHRPILTGRTRINRTVAGVIRAVISLPSRTRRSINRLCLRTAATDTGIVAGAIQRIQTTRINCCASINGRKIRRRKTTMYRSFASSSTLNGPTDQGRCRTRCSGCRYGFCFGDYRHSRQHEADEEIERETHRAHGVIHWVFPE